MNTTTTTNVTMSLTEQNNTIITEAVNAVLSEAIEHFNQRRTKRSADDERYFFKQSEVETVLSNLLHPEWVKVKIEYDVDGITPFCYTMDYGVVFPATRNCTTRRRKTANV
nr:MAG TPA: hypothetical protein [Siphoviridae sp. ctngg6]